MYWNSRKYLTKYDEIFTQGSIIRFEPWDEDVAYAEQASDYVNHIFNKDNNGYSILHTMFKDALISKNGFVKYYWKEIKAKKSYESLTAGIKHY